MDLKTKFKRSAICVGVRFVRSAVVSNWNFVKFGIRQKEASFFGKRTIVK